jgi:Na+-transporting NADH:ubiquinone oxidoreductase subunit C
MSKDKVSFLDSNLYPILFMLVVTIIFVGVLSIFYRSTEKGIEIQKQQTFRMQILSLFADTLAVTTGIDKAKLQDINNLNDNYKKYIIEKKLSTASGVAVNPAYYEASAGNGVILGYCFNVTGSGLWGTMRGLLAVTPDFKKIINFIIYDQMETPGLGARVEEPWFKSQFAGKSLITNAAITTFSLIPEGATPQATQIKQITGATITSSSVLKIIQASALELTKDFNLKAK